MDAESRLNLRSVMRLKTLCVGKSFQALSSNANGANGFPGTILRQTTDFDFHTALGTTQALAEVRSDQDIDLLFLDADEQQLVQATMFVSRLRELRPRLPLIIFSDHADDTMRYLLRSGATWHYLKTARVLKNLAADLNEHIFLPIRWADLYDYYGRDDVKPRIEPGLDMGDLEAIRKNPEEQYIIKRLFSSSDVVQIFRMDEGLSGSRIYTVKPRHQLKRILKIGPIDDLEAVSEKQETLIQPRLFRQVGQIRGQVISAEQMAGACYSLAGSKQDAMTITKFLQDPNHVRKEILDQILVQLRESLRELYNGSIESELRYWAPLYSRILPPNLTLTNATWVTGMEEDAAFILDASDLASISAVPNSGTIAEINNAVRQGKQPGLVLRGFEISEVHPGEGIVYLQDAVVERYAADPLLKDKEHPVLRFKVYMSPEQRDILHHPAFRRGKKVAVHGQVVETQETCLARHITAISGQAYDFANPVLEMASALYPSPLDSVHHLLWGIGREDMIDPAPMLAPVVHGDLNGGNILVEVETDVAVWLIDFSDARSGHVYFDLAKLEVEFRTHVFYRLFSEMVSEKLWDEATTTKFLLLVETLLIQYSDSNFEAFTAALRDFQSDWYDALYTQFPLYFENLLYFVFALRQAARTISPERFRAHYPVAVFFQSIAALKYDNLDLNPWQPWAKRLALCSALVCGKDAIAQSNRPRDIARLLGRLRQRSALALVTVGQGEDRKYLMQWNKNWGRFNLIGGRINNQDGDRDSFARTMQRKIKGELGLRSAKDYQIVRERQPVLRQQFSRRQHVFKEYEFRVFEIQLLPRHPRNEEEFQHFAHRLSGGQENVLLTPAEINHLRTANGRPISETTRTVLQTIGEIEVQNRSTQATSLAFHLDELRPLVSRGQAKITGSLVNTGFGKLIENILVEILPRPGYEIEPNSTVFHIDRLDAGYDFPLEISVQPREQDTKLTMRVTYYDTRGQEFQQVIEHPIQFRTPLFSLFQLDNPYLPGKPLNAGNDTLFVGREDVFSWLAAALLHKDRAQSVVLTGPPRIGKTSLLLQLVNGSLGRIIRSHARSFLLPVYFNLQDQDLQNTSHLFSRWSQAITRALRNRGIVVPPPEVWPDNKNGFTLFDKYLDQVESGLPRDGRIVLILDDIDHLRVLIDEGWVSDEVLAYLRSLMLHRSRVSLILAGSHHVNDKFWQIVTSAGEVRDLPRLSRKQSEQLIREPVQPHIHIDDRVVEHIWRLTGGHPYMLQLLGSRLVREVSGSNKAPLEIEMTHLNKVVEILLEEDDGYLMALWENIPGQAKMALATLAACVNDADMAVPWPQIAERITSASGDLQTLSQADFDLLVANGLLTHVPATPDLPRPAANGQQKDHETYSAYMLAFDLLRHWLLKNHPFEEVLSSAFQQRAMSSLY